MEYLISYFKEFTGKLVAIGFTGSTIGALFTWCFGGWEVGLKVLVSCMVLDYATGLMCGWKEKDLNSSRGFKGLKKKFTILLILILAVLLDRLLGQCWTFRTMVIYFYVAIEGISILENAVKLGVPIPRKLENTLEQLKK
ncbi:holin family protein [Clostridium sp. MT-14]|uniref:phage holin family protein n=1 Tax=Clostridium sp. MT-14 TaxID=3348360 RepID=UPI0035F31880